MPEQLPREASVLGAVRELSRRVASNDRPDEAMASVMAETSLLTLSNLDDWERKLRAEGEFAEPAQPQSRWKFWNRPECFASWLDLCSANGFRRENILRCRQGQAANAFFLALALRRLNDWVPEVRVAARESLPHLAEASSTENVVSALWYTLAHCGSWGRMGAAERQLLVELTTIGNVAPALSLRILRAAAGPAAHVLAEAGRGPALDPYLREFAGQAVQPSVRAMAYRCLVEERIVWTVGRKWIWTELQWCKGRFERITEERALPKTERMVELLAGAVSDRSVLVRRVAADLVIDRLDQVQAEAPDIVMRLATDPNRTVAERGRYAFTVLDKKA
jgi:hypothetical protein